MKTRTQVWALAAAMALIVVSACSDGNAPTPLTPTPPQAAPQAPAPAPGTLYSLSGVVFEATPAGNAPVPGVEVYCEPCGPPDGHLGQVTDARGAFSFDGVKGVARGSIPILLAKQGYVLPNQPDQSGPTGLSWMGGVSVTVTGDTRFDIQVIRK